MTLRPALVDGVSMEPTFLPGDLVLVALRRRTKLQRGDIVLAALDLGCDRRTGIKRVASGPDEWFEFELQDWPFFAKAGISRYHTSPDEVLLVGDNPTYSIDSRRLGPVGVDRIRGHVVWRFRGLNGITRRLIRPAL